MIFVIFIFITGVYLGQEFKQLPSVFLSTKHLILSAQGNSVVQKSFLSKLIEYIKS